MDDPRDRIRTTLRPVMDAAVGLGDEHQDFETALRALRQVETAVELATDLLMHGHLDSVRAT